ncbi:MAG: ABC transporter permease subunit [Pseudomonadota bacterium]
MLLSKPVSGGVADALLRQTPRLTIGLLLLPVGAGIFGTLAPALGWMPALGGSALTLDAFRSLIAWPGFWEALRLSLVTGIVSTALSLGLTLWLVASWQGTALFRTITRLLSPLLSVPHAAAAFGIAFLIAPSGWIARLFSPWATGWTRPPDLLIVQDPWGLTLILGLVAKETPFLLLMTLAALQQVDGNRSRILAESMGYGRVTAWMKTVLPLIYPQIRLPVYAVLAYGMSVVDMAVILGPTRPSPLAVQTVTWITDPDLSLRFQASAAASVLLFAVIAALIAWWLTEKLAARAGQRWVFAGARGARRVQASRGVALSLAATSSALVFLGMLGLALWSFTGLWRFPDVLPASYRLTTWEREGPVMFGTATDTVLLAGTSVALALVFVIGCLEAETRLKIRVHPASLLILYLPLLVPQIGFLPGLQTLAISFGVDGGFWVVVAAHLVFVLPYMFLSLADPWRALNPQYETVAAALGAGPNRSLFAIRLPLLLRPILTASAVGFAVSVGQYLPTLLIGGGRVETLTTEAVALASGGNRRIIGVYALAQMILPFVAFALALIVPTLLFRRRRGMAIS